jgi:NADH-quinone oxidoreductase subunit L
MAMGDEELPESDVLKVSGAHELHDHHTDPQDMMNMGGLRHKMPRTYWTYMVGTLALIGIFPLAGFWSKDEILAEAWLQW